MRHKYKEKEIAGLKTYEISGDPEKGAIVLLHGFGANAFDLMPLNEVHAGPTWLFPEGPLAIPFSANYTGKAWFPVNIELLSNALREGRYDDIAHAFPPEIEQAQQQINIFLGELQIPRSKIVLGGFSQGAILSIETALKSTQKIGGLLILSGTVINEASWTKLAPLHAHTPFFQSHGTHDPLLPIQKAESLEKLLQTAGLKGKLHPFQGGHEIPHATLTQLAHFLKHLYSRE